MAMQTYPLDDIDYSGDDAALFHCTRTTGIYGEDDFSFSVTGADNIVKLEPGLAWMRISRFKGLVTALKQETDVDMGLPDSVYPRIDRVILQFDANRNDTQVVVKKGSPASSPRPPERSTTEALYEIHLLEVRREPGAVSITAKDVQDLRLDPESCGLMVESVSKVDTSAINTQAMALIADLREEIQNVKDGTAFVMKSGDTMKGPLNVPSPTEDSHATRKDYVDAKYIYVTLTVSGWSASVPYTQTVTVAGVTAQKPPHITPVYPGTDAEDKALMEAAASVSYAKPGDGTVTFTCLESKPAMDIPIQCEVRN